MSAADDSAAAPAPAQSAGPLSPMAWLLRGGVTAYQWTIRPVIGANCRFEPSCSAYAKEALAAHGAAKGSLLAARRILRCNPWNEGGYDPVPPCTCAVPPGRARKA
jgi:putative membrane protein insertion efficiency factor